MELTNKIKNIISSFWPKHKVRVNTFILGAQKSGTTSLFDYLSLFPTVIGSKRKEINFFNHSKNFEKGYNWYHTLFGTFIKKPFQKVIFLEATPNYLYDKEAPQRIFNYNRDSKFLILLREPVGRAYSAWNMYKQFSEKSSKEKDQLVKNNLSGHSDEKVENFKNLISLNPFPTFEEMVEKELSLINKGERCQFGIIGRGLYEEQILSYLSMFDKDQFYFIESEKFKKQKNEVLNKVAEFLGLGDMELIENKLLLSHVREYSTPINKEIKLKLKEFYKPYNLKLFKLIGETFNW